MGREVRKSRLREGILRAGLLARGGLAVLVVLGTAACALPPQHEYELAPGQAWQGGLDTALLVPINETARVPRGLDKGEKAVFELVRAYLEEQGLAVEVPERGRYLRAARSATLAAQREAMAGTGGSVAEDPSFADLVPHLLEELGSEADLVIAPNMAIRPAEWVSKSLRWDGVRRYTPGAGGLRGSGIGRAASLHVAVFTRDGTRVFSGYGGLDVLWGVNVSEERMELLEDRLEEPRHLREGVCVAFHPYFGEDETC